MSYTSRLKMTPEALDAFCRRWKITELALFGSVLHDDFDPARSDVDMLVTFAPGAGWTLLDFVAMQRELKGLVGREVDLVERKAVEHSRNYIRRKAILNSAEVIYAAHAAHPAFS